MWSYRATLIRAHDADTLTILADTGFGGRQQVDVRLLGVSAPELSQPGGQECRLFTAEWLAEVGASDPRAAWPLRVQTVPSTAVEPSERRSFVRYLGTVYGLAGGRCLNGDLAVFLAGHPEWGTGS